MIPLFSRTKDGMLIVEVSAAEFIPEWKKADRKHKTLLAGARPAVMRDGDALDSRPHLVTMHESMWDRIKFKIGAIENLERLSRNMDTAHFCPDCGHELKMVEEFEDIWQMKCKICELPQVFGKNLYGGTVGSGQREKT